VVESLALEVPASLARALGAVPRASADHDSRDRGAAADVLLTVIVEGVPTVLAYLQGPTTLADLARLIRAWRRSEVAAGDRVRIRAVRTATKVEISIDAPANVSVRDLERLIRPVVDSSP
jgi:hypothetical protein